MRTAVLLRVHVRPRGSFAATRNQGAVPSNQVSDVSDAGTNNRCSDSAYLVPDASDSVPDAANFLSDNKVPNPVHLLSDDPVADDPVADNCYQDVPLRFPDHVHWRSWQQVNDRWVLQRQHGTRANGVRGLPRRDVIGQLRRGPRHRLSAKTLVPAHDCRVRQNGHRRRNVEHDVLWIRDGLNELAEHGKRDGAQPMDGNGFGWAIHSPIQLSRVDNWVWVVLRSRGAGYRHGHDMDRVQHTSVLQHEGHRVRVHTRRADTPARNKCPVSPYILPGASGRALIGVTRI